MNLKKKILVGYGVTFSLMGVVVAWAIFHLWSLATTTDEILRNYYRSILAVENMVDAIGRQDSGILLILMGDVDKGVAQYRENETLFLEWLGRSRNSIAVEGESAAIQAIEAGYSEFRRQVQQLAPGWGIAGTATTLTLESYRKTILPAYNKIKAQCLELRMMHAWGSDP